VFVTAEYNHLMLDELVFWWAHALRGLRGRTSTE
jgi:hypothetical protein